MAALEREPAGRATDLAAPLEQIAATVKKRGLIVLLSDLLAPTDALRTRLGYLRSRGHDVVVLRILDPAEVRTLLRQAQDVLTKGDYLAGLTFARNAEEATRRLEAQIEDERRHRGIQKPRSGICNVCRSRRVTFQDDGWGRCNDCGNAFRWRGAVGVWERLRGLIR